MVPSSRQSPPEGAGGTAPGPPRFIRIANKRFMTRFIATGQPFHETPFQVRQFANPLKKKKKLIRHRTGTALAV
ncbi:hypothetical protein [Azospirillum palustre]